MSGSFPRSQRGVSLIEILLVATLVAAAAVSVFLFAKKASLTAAVQTEQHQVETIIKTVDSLFALHPNFAALGTDGANFLSNTSAKMSLRLGTNASGKPALLTDLGQGKGSISLSSASISEPGSPSAPDNGYRLLYTGLQAKECSYLVTSTQSLAHRISVGSSGNEAAAQAVSLRGKLSKTPDILAQLCAQPSAAVFMYFMPSRAISASLSPTAPPLAQCHPVEEKQISNCPTGQIGSITQQRVGNCTGPANSMVYTAWTTIENTCQQQAVVQPNELPEVIPQQCSTIKATRVLPCGSGQVGQITQQNETNTCDGSTTGWLEVGNSCQSAPPAATCTPSVQSQVVACPAGQGGQITRMRSSVCASPTATPTWPAWNTSHVISNTCTTSCSQGGSSCCSPRRETRTGPQCPAGTYGAAPLQERFLACVGPATQASTWSSWQSFVSDSCVSCPATTNETRRQWVDRTGTCPPGEVGEIKYKAEQISTRSVSYNCPAGTTALPSPTISTWGSWTDTGATSNEVNTCKPVVGRLQACSGRDNIVSRQLNLAQINAANPNLVKPVRACNSSNKGQASWQIMTNKNYPAHSVTDQMVEPHVSKSCGASAMWVCDGSNWINTQFRVENASAGNYTNSCADGSKVGGWVMPGSYPQFVYDGPEEAMWHTISAISVNAQFYHHVTDQTTNTWESYSCFSPMTDASFYEEPKDWSKTCWGSKPVGYEDGGNWAFSKYEPGVGVELVDLTHLDDPLRPYYQPTTFPTKQFLCPSKPSTNCSVPEGYGWIAGAVTHVSHTRGAACPSGKTGWHTWEQREVSTRTCNNGTWSAWSGYTWDPIRYQEVNTCR